MAGVVFHCSTVKQSDINKFVGFSKVLIKTYNVDVFAYIHVMHNSIIIHSKFRMIQFACIRSVHILKCGRVFRRIFSRFVSSN